MQILIVLTCIVLLVLFITWFKVNAFLSFLIVSAIAALALGIDPSKVGPVLQKGVGDMLGSLVIVVVAGSMLGKLVAETGAAQQISSGLMKLFGERYLQVAFMITGFVIGVPLFYNVGFILVFPLIASVVYRFKLPAVYVGLPMVASLSVTHGFLPPHPSPVALVAQFQANMGMTLLYGTLIAIPTVIIAGPLFAKTLKHINATLIHTFKSETIPENKLPSLFNSLFSALLPVLLLAITTIAGFYIDKESTWFGPLAFIGDSSVVMLISLCVATFTLGIWRGFTMKAIMEFYVDSVKDVAMIVLIMGGAGTLKQVLIESGVSAEIASLMQGFHMHPLVLGWLIACIIRVCVGSATVAGLTAAGIVAPILFANPTVNPNLMVLAVGAGSLMFSHVNDAGFWLFKEYFNLSIKDTIRSWSLMETIVSICGLAGVLLLNMINLPR
jgi:Gnt-I system high-affinity gluconate transporter